jgi:archaeosortase B (VPXXXP-CTERM-specific)
MDADEQRPVEDDAQGKPTGGLARRAREAWDNPALRFVGLFLAYLGTASYVYPLLRDRYRILLEVMTQGTTKLEYYLFLPFVEDLSTNKSNIIVEGFSVRIIEECTGIYEAIIFSSAVLAFPTSWAKRAIGFGLGVPIIYAFNLLRIMVLVVVGKYYPDSFEFMHLYFWQATLIIMITSVWALWIFKVVIRENPADTDT